MDQLSDKLYAGIDLHKSYCFMTIVNQSGYIQHQARYENDKDDLVETLSRLGNIEAVVESTYGWYWLADKLEQRQIPFKLAHPKKVNAIADKKKTDREDAKILADLLRTNLLPTSYIPKKKTRAVKELYRFRMGLVEQRANSKRRLHDILRKQNLTCPYTDILGKRSLKWLIEKRMPFPYKGETKSLIKIAAVLNQQINIYDKRIKQLTADNPEAKLLRTIPGVGAILSLIIAMEIGEISRFANNRALAS
ncbi:MAG: IS110 family transposase [Patescibacteria group bacterium]